MEKHRATFRGLRAVRPVFAVLLCALCLAARADEIRELSPVAGELQRQAAELSAQGAHEAALEKLQRLLELTDRHTAVVADYIIALSRSGNAAAAVSEYETLSPDFPKPSALTLEIAHSYRQLRQLEKARVLYAYLLEKSPGNEEAARGLVLTLFDLGRSADALDLLDRVAPSPKSPGSDEATLAAAPKPPSARDLHRQALDLAGHGGVDLALDLLEKALGQGGEQMVIRVDYVKMLARAGRCEKAVQEFEALPPAAAEDPELCRVMAGCYRNTEQIDKAMAMLRTVLTRVPDDAAAALDLGTLLLKTDNAGEARDVMQAAVLRHPQDVALLLCAVRAEMALGDFPAVEKTCDRILRLDPENRKAAAIRARALMQLAESSPSADRAASLLEKAVSQPGVEPTVIEAYVSTLVRQGRFQEATTAFEALQSEDVALPCLLAVANAYAAQDNAERARELYALALATDPDNQEAALGQASALNTLGRHAEVADQLADFEPEGVVSIPLLLVKARANVELDRREAALATLDSVLELDRDNATARNQKADLLIQEAHISECERALELFEAVLELTGRTEAARIEYIRMLAKCGKTDAAILEFEALPQTADLPPYLTRAVAECYHLAGRPDEAKALYAQVLDYLPEDHTAALGLADLLAGEERFIEALAILNRALSLHPRNTDLLLEKARIQAAKLDYRDAVTTLESLLTVDADNLDAQRELAHTLLQIAKFSDCDDALAFIRKAMDLDPRSNNAQTLYITTLADCGLNTDAIAAYSNLQKEVADSPTVLKSIAECYYREGELAEAIASYRAALDASPEDSEVALRLAAALSDAEQLDGAVAELDKALAVNPDRSSLLLERARLLAANEAYADAMSAYEQLLELEPEHDAARIEVTDLLIDLAAASKAEDTVPLLEKAMRLGGPTPRVRSALVQALSEAGRHEEALRHFDKIADPDSLSTETLRAAALSYSRQDRRAAATRLYRSILQRDPTDTQASLRLIGVLRESGNLDDALAVCGEALRHGEDQLDLLFAKAAIETETRAFSAALATYDEILTSNPDTPIARNLKGYVYLEIARYSDCEAARGFIAKARTLAGDSPAIQLEEIQILLRCNRIEDATAAYDALPTTVAVPPELLKQLALGYRKLMRYDRAQTIYSQLLEENPGDADTAEALMATHVESSETMPGQASTVPLEAAPKRTNPGPKAAAVAAPPAPEAELETKAPPPEAEPDVPIPGHQPRIPDPNPDVQSDMTPDPAPVSEPHPPSPNSLSVPAQNPDTKPTTEVVESVSTSLTNEPSLSEAPGPAETNSVAETAVQAESELPEEAAYTKEAGAGSGMRAALVRIDALATAENPSGLLNELVERARAIGLDTFIIKGYVNSGLEGGAAEAWFNNDVIPVRANVLPVVARQLRESGFRVFVSMPVLSVILPDRNRRTSLHVLDWRGGRPHVSRAWPSRLTPFNAEVQKLVSRLYASLAVATELDGIVFEDDAYLTDTEDFHPAAVEGVKKALGVPDLSPDAFTRAELEAWQDLKTEQLTAFTAALMRTVRRYHPDADFGRMLFGPTLHRPESRGWLAQDYSSAVETYDYVFLVVSPEMEDVAIVSPWLNKLVELASNIPDGLQKTVFTVQSFDQKRNRHIAGRLVADRVEKLLLSGARHVCYDSFLIQDNYPPENRLRRVLGAQPRKGHWWQVWK